MGLFAFFGAMQGTTVRAQSFTITYPTSTTTITIPTQGYTSVTVSGKCVVTNGPLGPPTSVRVSINDRQGHIFYGNTGLTNGMDDGTRTTYDYSGTVNLNNTAKSGTDCKIRYGNYHG